MSHAWELLEAAEAGRPVTALAVTLAMAVIWASGEELVGAG